MPLPEVSNRSHVPQSESDLASSRRKTFSAVAGAVVGIGAGLAYEKYRPEKLNTKISRGRFVAKTLGFIVSGMGAGLTVEKALETPE
jgi:hypothetical protein